MIPRNEEQEATDLYQRLILAWNNQDAAGFASTVAIDGNVVGFDGSQMNGSAEVKSQLEAIFREHKTPPYLTKILEIRVLTKEVVLLRAAAGMIPEGNSDIDSALNAVQTMVAELGSDGWQIALFQNTPAQFHGHPELSEAFTQELRKQGTLNSSSA